MDEKTNQAYAAYALAERAFDAGYRECERAMHIEPTPAKTLNNDVIHVTGRREAINWIMAEMMAENEQ